MKKSMVMVIVAAFFLFAVFPSNSRAGGAASGAVIGGAIGLVVGTIVYLFSLSSEKTMDEQKLEKQQKKSEMPYFLRDGNTMAIEDLSGQGDREVVSFSRTQHVVVSFAF